MATETMESRDTTSEFKPPEVAVGDMVLWGPDKNSMDYPAIIVARSRNGRYLDLNITQPMVGNFMDRTGVPHQDDPRVRTTLDEEVGVWRESPMHRRMQGLHDDFEDLKLSLAGSPNVKPKPDFSDL